MHNYPLMSNSGAYIASLDCWIDLSPSKPSKLDVFNDNTITVCHDEKRIALSAPIYRQSLGN